MILKHNRKHFAYSLEINVMQNINREKMHALETTDEYRKNKLQTESWKQRRYEIA